ERADRMRMPVSVAMILLQTAVSRIGLPFRLRGGQHLSYILSSTIGTIGLRLACSRRHASLQANRKLDRLARRRPSTSCLPTIRELGTEGRLWGVISESDPMRPPKSPLDSICDAFKEGSHCRGNHSTYPSLSLAGVRTSCFSRN